MYIFHEILSIQSMLLILRHPVACQWGIIQKLAAAGFIRVSGYFINRTYFFSKNVNKQAWKLSAIKGETNLSILWEVRQISSFCRKAITAKKSFLAKKFDQVWSIFDRSDPKKIKNQMVISILSVNVTTFYSNIFWLVRNPIWSSLIHFGQIWSKTIKKTPDNLTFF